MPTGAVGFYGERQVYDQSMTSANGGRRVFIAFAVGLAFAGNTVQVCALRAEAYDRRKSLRSLRPTWPGVACLADRTHALHGRTRLTVLRWPQGSSGFPAGCDAGGG